MWIIDVLKATTRKYDPSGPEAHHMPVITKGEVGVKQQENLLSWSSGHMTSDNRLPFFTIKRRFAGQALPSRQPPPPRYPPFSRR